MAVNVVPGDGIGRIVNIWPGYYEASIYGLAIDLGSTTIAAHLTDLGSGKVIASSGIMNPQIRFDEPSQLRDDEYRWRRCDDQRSQKSY